MQSTTFNPNFSIFDKSIDMEQLDGNQFWPKERKSPYKFKKIISKVLKSLRHKVFQKNRKEKSNLVESVASPSLIENNVEPTENDSNALEIKTILYEEEERTPVMIKASRNISCDELKMLIEQKIGYSLYENFVFVHINYIYGDSIEEHYERIYDMNFLNYLNNLKKIFLIDGDFKFMLSSASLNDKIEFLLVDKNQLCWS